jgi:hypothetical protein
MFGLYEMENMEEDINSLYKYTFDLLIKKKKTINDVIKLLVNEKELTEQDAFDVIQDIFSYVKRKEKKDAQRNIGIGVVIFLFSITMGVALFVFPSMFVVKGDFYLMYFGLMITSFIFGGVQLVRGLIRFVEDKSLNMDNYVINNVSREKYTHLERSAINNFENNTLEDPYYYDKEITKINMEKGKVKLSTEILEILSEDGYRPILEENEYGGWMIRVKIEGIDITIMFDKEDFNYAIIRCCTCTFDSKRRYEMFERINKVNRLEPFICMMIEEEVICTASDIRFYNNLNMKEILLWHIAAVLCANEEFWRLEEEERNSLN